MENSSEDESLASVKRKSSTQLTDNEKRVKIEEDSDDEGLLPSALVTVEVNDDCNEETAVDYSLSSRPVRQRKPRVTLSPETHKSAKPGPKAKARVCPICEAEFKTREELAEHEIQHEVQTRHKCTECSRCFKNDFALRLHKKVHDEKKLKCDFCGATFNMLIHLGRHMSFHHKNEKCTTCGASFHTKEELSEHTCSTKWSRKNDASKKQDTPDKIQITHVKVEADFDSDEEVSQFSGESKDTLSHHVQCSIVSKMLKGRSVNDICQLYNLKAEVVNQIWEDRDEYDVKKKAGRTSVKYMNSIINTKILDWFYQQKSSGVQLSGKMVTDYAEALAKDLGFVAFNGSKKWLDRFKQRYKISFRSTPYKRNFSVIPTKSKWKKQFFEDWNDTRNGYTDDMIYTADEVGVFYNPSKDRIKKLGGKKYVHGAPKDRLAIFLCANMSGTDKKRLLVCGSEDPLLRSLRNPDNLPATYIRHAEAHFTTPMFEQYVKYWNKQLQVDNKKALLVVDRAGIHTKLTLSNLKLVYVPWKAYAALMPIKNGIYTRFRNDFRRLILQEKAMNCFKGVDRSLTCLEALNVAEKAWSRMPKEVIAASFEAVGFELLNRNDDDPKNGVNGKHAPFVAENVDHALSDEELCKYMTQFDIEPYYADLSTMDNYLSVDEEMLTGQGSNVSVFGGNHKVVDKEKQQREIDEILPINTEKPTTEDGMLVHKFRALQDLEIVKRYLQTNVTSHEVYENLMDIECFLLKPV